MCYFTGDPRKMFTDSSFYSSKHHPTVADQVEMAHRLTSALFKEDNKHSKGQQMYLNRMKKSGKLIHLAEFFCINNWTLEIVIVHLFFYKDDNQYTMLFLKYY